MQKGSKHRSVISIFNKIFGKLVAIFKVLVDAAAKLFKLFSFPWIRAIHKHVCLLHSCFCCFFFCLFVCLCACFLFICLFVCLFLYLLAYLFVCLFACVVIILLLILWHLLLFLCIFTYLGSYGLTLCTTHCCPNNVQYIFDVCSFSCLFVCLHIYHYISIINFNFTVYIYWIYDSVSL